MKENFVFVVIVLLFFAVHSAPAALAAEEQGTVKWFDIDVLDFHWQSVVIRDRAGNDLGPGQFKAVVTNSPGDHDIIFLAGHFTGEAFEVIIEPTGASEIIYDGTGNPVGAVMNGRAEVTWDGQTESFATTVMVKDDDWPTTLPDFLIWDIPGPPNSDGFTFSAVGRLVFREE